MNEGPGKGFSILDYMRAPAERRTNEISLDKVNSSEEFLNAVDFDALNEIMEEIARKSGRRMLRRVHRRDIEEDSATLDAMSEVKGGSTVEGGADPLNFKIHFSWEKMQKSAEAFEGKVPAGVRALYALVHEMTHLYGFREHRLLPAGHKDLRFEGEGLELRTGYSDQQFGADPGNLSEVAVSLNEAVTEELALEAVNEYVRRTGESAMFDGHPEARKVLSTATYPVDRLVLQAVIGSLASRLEVDRDTVWRSFVRGYFSPEGKTAEFVVEIMRTLMDHAPSALAASQLLEGFVLNNVRVEDALQGFEYEQVRDAVEKFMHSTDRGKIEDALGYRKK